MGNCEVYAPHGKTSCSLIQMASDTGHADALVFFSVRAALP